MGKDKNTHPFLAEDINFQMFQSCCEKNNLIGFWERFDISLPWWLCLMGREREKERCPMLKSYLSCLPNDFWEMQSAYSSLWPSVSLVYRLCQLNQAHIKTTSLEFVWRLKVFLKLGDMLRQCCPCCC